MAVRVSGPDLRPVRAAADGATPLEWNTPGVLDREVVIEFDLPLPGGGEPWNLRVPVIEDAVRLAARTFVIPLPGTGLSSEAGRISGASASLPAWVGVDVPAAGALEVETTDAFTVQPRALARLTAETARVPKASFQTRLVADGAQLCEAEFAIRHRGPLRWRFTLPAGSELLSCEVEGGANNPLLVEGGALELAMDGPGDDETSVVRLSYTARHAAFEPVEGRLALSLPATPLFVDELVWNVALPDGYEATAFEGNVEPSRAAAGIGFRKRLVRNAAAVVEIYYRKRDTTSR
jgi:hypothetical protein